MHVIIPMSGSGQRFVDAGYRTLKPLIRVGRKRIIEHVVDMFPANVNFIFICRDEHLRSTDMRSVLNNLQRRVEILEIPSHKLGPVYALHLVKNRLIQIDDEVIVNYCDFFTDFLYDDFLKEKLANNPHGMIFTYTGFHPHMLNDGNYAFVKKEGIYVKEVKEKEAFTDNRMNEEASSGTYYFNSMALLLEATDWALQNEINKNGEYYVSLLYNFLVLNNFNITTFNVSKMLQWGTPNDLEDYMFWYNYFTQDSYNNLKSVFVDNLVLPMAGAGSRFKENGYSISKPFLNVNGKQMWQVALGNMPSSTNSYLIIQNVDSHYLEHTSLNVTELKSKTDGQSSTVNVVVKDLMVNNSLFISSIDQIFCLAPQKLNLIILKEDCDIVVLSSTNHKTAINKPNMFGWLRSGISGFVEIISVKKPIDENFLGDSIIIGSFYFRSVKLFKELYRKQLELDLRVNGEFYIDSLLEIGLKEGLRIKELQVDEFISLGTPNDYESYCYWEEYFKK